MTSAGASAFRSCETWYCSAFPAVAGGPSGQSSSMSRSAETTSFARVSSSASSARCLGPPSASVRPCSTTSSGPRIRNSTSCLRGRRYHRPHRLSEPSAAPQAPGWLGPTTRVWWREGRLEHVSVETDIHTGTDFVGYRLEQLVGEGGMGVVYRAYDRRMKRTVALKFVAPRLALDGRFRERFLREIELAAAFEHPNAVPIHDAGDVDGRLYLAMRYVEGSDLAVLLRSEGPLEPARAVRICAQVARALDAAHASGLVHRDVKPSNVLLDAGEHVYVADFGLTRRLADERGPLLEGSSLGTAAYVAPEQLEGEPVDGRADLYSLACLLYECLTGEPPFRHDSRLAVAWAHLEEEPPSASARNATLPAAVDDALAMGLAKDPADRQQTCAALIAAAETALGLQAPRRRRGRAGCGRRRPGDHPFSLGRWCCRPASLRRARERGPHRPREQRRNRRRACRPRSASSCRAWESRVGVQPGARRGRIRRREDEPGGSDDARACAASRRQCLRRPGACGGRGRGLADRLERCRPSGARSHHRLGAKADGVSPGS